MRPRTLAELLGQDHLLAPGSPLRLLASADTRADTASVILWGPPGTGKTTLAKLVADLSERSFVELSAVTASVKDVRQVMEHAAATRDVYGRATVLFLDEIHRFSRAQQDALLPGVESGTVTLIAATTENPSFSVISPLLSRSLLLTLNPLDDDAVTVLLRRALEDRRGLAGGYTLSAGALRDLVRYAGGDARRALTSLSAAAAIAAKTSEKDTIAAAEDSDTSEAGKKVAKQKTVAAPPANPPHRITRKIVALAIDRAPVRYDRAGDQHYDVISAFIKSMRGSDPDAALHYLARMIAGGEDPRFIARRLMIHAAEDVGLADPRALTVAVAAAQAAERVGFPEARLPLAEATIYIATAPKSNSVLRGIDAALAAVNAGGIGEVPPPLRDAHHPGAKRQGAGVGYRYPHDDARGVLEQDYLPSPLAGVRYYTPTTHGDERIIAERLERLRRIQKPGS